MWSPSLPIVRIGLSQQGITVAHMSRFGLGPVARVERLPCDPAVTANATHNPTDAAARLPWRPALEQLGHWLDRQKGRRYQVQLVLSDRFVRWQILPWRVELSGVAERTAYAALRFRETYGRAAQDWSILPANLPPGQPAPAAAVDTALLEALRASCQSSGSRLQSIAPYYSSAFDHWRRIAKGPACWFGSVDTDTLTLGLLQGGRWTALQTQRLASDWRAPLPALMAQIALACAVPEATIPLYLCGDLSPPTPQPDLPFTWLSPQQLPDRTAPGLRLALGR